MNKLKAYIYFIIILLLNSSCDNSQIERSAIKEGTLDLTTWDFAKNGTVNLNGEWEFYWEEFLEPSDFQLNNSAKKEFIYVPKAWSVKKNEDKIYPKYGYATYRLKIKIPDKEKDYKFKFLSIFSSAKVWVNGEFCFENGKIARSKEKSEPKYLINYILENKIKNKSNTIEIIIQVSDFYKGGTYAGIKRKITFGTANLIYEEKTSEKSLTLALVAILLVMALYHLFLYAYRRKETSYLIFSIISLVSASRSLFNAGVFSDIFSYDIYGRFGFMPVVIYPALLVYFFHLLYKKEVNKKVTYFFLIFGALFTPFIFTGSPSVVPRIEPFLIAYVLSSLIYLLAYALIKVLLKRRQGSIFAYIGTFILFSSNIHDALYSQGNINGFGFFISEIGFGIYIILQSLNLAEIFTFSLRNNIKLNKMLDHQNKNLELIVEERTHEIKAQSEEILIQNENLKQQSEEIIVQNENLKQQSEEILVQNENLKQQSEEIRAQSEALEYQRDVANEQRDEIIASINYAERIQRAVLPSVEFAKETLSEHFILFKPRDIVSGDFYWIKQIDIFIIVAVADSTGHGVPGAFMSMLGSSFLNEIITAKSINNSGEILNELRNKIKNSLHQKGERGEQKDGMDIALYIINTKTLELQFSGANNPLYIIRNNNKENNHSQFVDNKKVRIFSNESLFEQSIIELRADNQPIAIFVKETEFKTLSFQLKKDDCLYTFSDGYADQFGGEEGGKFKINNFRNLLLSISEKSMEEQKEILEKDFEKWRGNNEQVDDVLVMGVRV